ncbi:P-loop containing nucleoside triphosphate hydrolase protein [Phycomyces blakesleeanus]|uniref:P-loop containing nucleoside triphosphate hydrolase protein n=1 Tax=Phycomyces blakesleeanus TaxID=4837 RepID=A0ABR3AYJ4_PHYBL
MCTIEQSKRILILAPTIALDNWVNEFERWLSPDLQNIVGHAVNFNDPGLVNISLSRRMIFLDRWFVHGGILLMSYDQFRCLLKPTQIPLELEKLEKYLLNPGPSVLIADEGHRIKNSQAVITTLVNRINTPARVCLTGYPLQNNLAEYYHILDFASPGLFGSPNSFKNTYQKVIESTYADSSKSQLYMAKHALYQLHLLSSSCIHRKDASILKAELPPKVEYVINCKLLEVQHSLYIRMLEELRIASLNPLIGLILLRAICNHPFVFFKMSNNRKLPVQRKLTIPNGTISEDKTENTVGDVTGDATGNNNDNNTDPTEESSELLDDQIEAFDPNEIAEVESWKNTKALQWVTDAFKPLIDTWEMSSKMRIIMDIVKYASEIGDKVLIVSHSLLCLDYIGETLNTMGYKTLRIDGTTPQPVRQPCIDQFNDDPNEQTMLISARAGSIGVNIVGANRVILCDYDWNPCHEEQSIGRVYRYGQLKRVYIYRLVTNGTIEERLLNQGIHKRGISSRVIDNKRMTPQLEQDMKKYYSEPQKSYDPLKSDLGFDVDDPVMKKVIEGLRDCIANIRLGDSLTEPGFDNSPEVSKSDITKIKLEVYRIRSVHLRDVIRKYGR